MQIERARTLALRTVVIFGGKISEILMSRMIPDFEDLLCFVTQQPKISHVHRPRTLSLDGIINNTHGGGIIDVDGCGRLWVAHFLQSKSDDLCVDGVEK